MDAIELLKQDHRNVEALFAEFEKLGEKAFKSKAKVVARILHELEVHAHIEEQDFYPDFQSAAKDEKDMVLEAYEEHHVVKLLIAELKTMSPDAERYTAKVTVLKELIEHHVEEEEKEMFVDARKVISKEQLDQLGERMMAHKQTFAAEQRTPRVTVTMLRAEEARETKKK